jgi:hypothetical protein
MTIMSTIASIAEVIRRQAPTSFGHAETRRGWWLGVRGAADVMGDA